MASETRGTRSSRATLHLARAWAVVLIFATTKVAWSDESSASVSPTAMEKETARSLMEEGASRRTHGDLKGALASFVAADALVHLPTTGVEVAAALAAVGLLLEARSKAIDVTRDAPRPNEPPQFPAARLSASALSDQLLRSACT
jgi:hypothetical protein